jgi:transposase InsO family protein
VGWSTTPGTCALERAALAAMEKALAEWSAPAMVPADNGAAFAHRNRGKDKPLTSRFSRTLARDHQIRVIHSSPYHPQTCGKVERLHPSATKLLGHHYQPPPPRSPSCSSA